METRESTDIENTDSKGLIAAFQEELDRMEAHPLTDPVIRPLFAVAEHVAQDANHVESLILASGMALGGTDAVVVEKMHTEGTLESVRVNLLVARSLLREVVLLLDPLTTVDCGE